MNTFDINDDSHSNGAAGTGREQGVPQSVPKKRKKDNGIVESSDL